MLKKYLNTYVQKTSHSNWNLVDDEEQCIQINYMMWFALAHHFMYFYDDDLDTDIDLIRCSIEAFDKLRKNFFGKEQIRYYFVVDPNVEVQIHYK